MKFSGEVECFLCGWQHIAKWKSSS